MEIVPEGILLETSNLFMEVCGKRTIGIVNGDGDGNNAKDYDDDDDNDEDDDEDFNDKSCDDEKENDSLAKRFISIDKSHNQQQQKPQQSQLQFNILYTKDKQKKAKKWFDGRLDYNNHTGLAKFYSANEENGNVCFYKKVMGTGTTIAEGSEFESGIYIFQIENEIKEKLQLKLPQKLEDVNNSENVKRQKKNSDECSILASEEFPLDGRSDEDLLALLRSP